MGRGGGWLKCRGKGVGGGDRGEAAAWVEAGNFGWVVMWAAYREVFTAWACWTLPEPVMIEAVTPAALVTLMRGAEAFHGHPAKSPRVRATVAPSSPVLREWRGQPGDGQALRPSV